MRRTVVLDACVMDQVFRNNPEVKGALRRLLRSNARVYISTQAYNELTGGRAGVLVTGVGKSRVNPNAVGPGSAQMARAYSIVLHELGIDVPPRTSIRDRLPTYDANAVHSKMSLADSLTAAEARALNAELWTMEGTKKLVSAARQYGVRVAPESKFVASAHAWDYRNGLRFAGLNRMHIGANGSVTILPGLPTTPHSGPSRPPGRPSTPISVLPSTRGAAKLVAIELAFRGANYVVHMVNDTLEERKVRKAWELEKPHVEAALKKNPSLHAVVLFEFTVQHLEGEQKASLLTPLREFRGVRVGYGASEADALQNAASEARLYNTPHGGAPYDVVTERISIPPRTAANDASKEPPFPAYAVATFAPGRSRLQKVFYSVLGFDDSGQIELSVPSGVTPQFFLLKIPRRLEWVDDGRLRTRELDIVRIEPHAYSFLTQIQAIDLDPLVGIGDTKAAMVYPANTATARLFGRRGQAEDKDGLLRRIDPRFATVQWVRPEDIDIQRDFRERPSDGRPSRPTVSTPHEPPKQITPVVNHFNMEEDTARPKVLRN